MSFGGSKRPLSALAVIAALLFACSGGGQHSPAPASDPGLQNFYHNQIWGWSLSYPMDWSLDSRNSEAVALTAPSNGAAAFVGINSGRRPQSISRGQLLGLLVMSYEQSLGETFREISRRQYALSNGLPAAEVVYELGANRERMARIVLITIPDGRVVTINAETDRDSFSILEPDFDLVINSFKLD